MSADVSLITCTGYRPEAFALCQRWVGRQEIGNLDVEWVIVDDERKLTASYIRGNVPLDLLSHVTIVPGYDGSASCTMPINLHDALGYCSGDAIVIIEDDDWYARDYVRVMWRAVVEKENAAVGTGPKRYYHVGNPAAKYHTDRYPRWYEHFDDNYSSLCRTAFARSQIGRLKEICWDCHSRPPGEKVDISVDHRFWASTPAEDGKLLIDDAGLCVSIKGLPGRGGAGGLHDNPGRLKHVDKTWTKLYDWIGNDSEVYRELMRI